MNSKPISQVAQKGKDKFKNRVIRIVKLVPHGKVVSYGQVALYLGLPRSARQVGWILNRLGSDDLPWWRVVNNAGRISIKGSKYTAYDQAKLLRSEGVLINENLTINIEKYRFLPDQRFISKLGLDPSYLEFISSKLPFSTYFNHK